MSHKCRHCIHGNKTCTVRYSTKEMHHAAYINFRRIDRKLQRIKYPEKTKARDKIAYERKSKEAVREQSRKRRRNNQKRVNEICRRNQRKYIEELKDWYVIAKLIHIGFDRNDITQELIELKREQLKLTRKWKEKKLQSRV